MTSTLNDVPEHSCWSLTYLLTLSISDASPSRDKERETHAARATVGPPELAAANPRAEKAWQDSGQVGDFSRQYHEFSALIGARHYADPNLCSGDPSTVVSEQDSSAA